MGPGVRLQRLLLALVATAVIAGGLLWINPSDNPSEPVAPSPADERLLDLDRSLARILGSEAGVPAATVRAEGLLKRVFAETQAGEAQQLVRTLLDADAMHMRWGGLLGVAWYGPPDEALTAHLERVLAPRAPLLLRQAAARVVPYADPEDAPRFQTALLAGSRDPDPVLRTWSLRTLATSGQATPEVLGRLVEVLGEDEPELREIAVHGLARVELVERLDESALTRAVAVIAPLLDAKANMQRMYALIALSRTGEHLHEHLPRIVELLSDRNALVRNHAVQALTRAGDAGLERVREALASDDGARAETLTWVLRSMDQPGLDALAELDTHRVPLVRVYALRRRWEAEVLPTQELLAALAPHVEDAAPEVARAAIEGAARVGVPAAEIWPRIEAMAAKRQAAGTSTAALDAAIEAARASLLSGR